MIKTIIWKNNTVVLIDQRALPLAERYVACKSYKEVISAIKDLTVRGAPAIGVAAAMGTALGALQPSLFITKRIPANIFRYLRRNRSSAAHGTQPLLGAGAHEK